MRCAGVALLMALAVCSGAHAALPDGFVGLYADDSFFGNSSYRSAHMAAQVRAGVQTVRQPMEWSRVERRRGVFDFSAYDPYMADAARAGLEVLPFLVGPPAFRSSRPPKTRSRAMFPPKRNADFAAFATAAVKRYGFTGSFWRDHPQLPFVPVRAWQVWNEPNIPNFWRSGPDARRYTALLKAGSRAIRRADPDAEVVAGGLPNSALGVPLRRFLRGMYRAGARGSFDTLAIHPYSRHVEGLLRLVEDTRVEMDRHGDRSRLWITEFGWSTGGDRSAFRVSERGQSDRIAAVLSALFAERAVLRLRGFVLFKWRDAVAPPDLGSDPWPLHAGLLRADASLKPSYTTFSRVVADAGRRPGSFAGGDAGRTVIRPGRVRMSPRGFARLALGCRSPDPGACAGTLRLRTTRAVRCRTMHRRAGAPLAAARFRISVAPAIVPVRLPQSERLLVRCLGSIRVRATASSRAGRPARSKSLVFVLRAR